MHIPLPFCEEKKTKHQPRSSIQVFHWLLAIPAFDQKLSNVRENE
jgi:hypothetical protein